MSLTFSFDTSLCKDCKPYAYLKNLAVAHTLQGITTHKLSALRAITSPYLMKVFCQEGSVKSRDRKKGNMVLTAFVDGGLEPRKVSRLNEKEAREF